jgi:hypothetical protein
VSAPDIGSLLTSTSAERLPVVLLELHVRSLLDDDARALELARGCAVARWFDPAVVGALRGDRDPPADRRLVAALAEFSLVHRRRDGAYAFHDTIRRAIADDLRAEDPEQLGLVHRRLAEHHAARLANAETLERDLRDVADVVRDANRERLAHLIRLAEQRLIDPLLEAQHHFAGVSPEEGLTFFGAQAHRLYTAGLSKACTWFVRAVAEDLRRHRSGPEFDRWRAWVAYWQALLPNRRAGEVAEELQALKDSETVIADPHLHVSILRLLATMLRTNAKLRQSQETYEEARRIAQAGEAASHLSGLLYEIGDLQLLRSDLDGARATFAEVLAVGGDEASVHARIDALLGLSRVLLYEGEGAPALESALEAVDLARTHVPRDAAQQRLVGEACLEIFARHEPSLLHTVKREVEALLPESSDPASRIGLACHYAASLRMSGRWKAAAKVLAEASELEDPAQPNVGLSYERGELWHELGRLEDAALAYEGMLEAEASTDWDRAAALVNGGHVELHRDPARAEAMLREGERAWSECEHDVNAAIATMGLAGALARLGRHDEATTALESASAGFAGAPKYLKAEERECGADLARLRGEHREATAGYRAAAAEYASLGLLRESAVALALEAGSAARCAAWGLAAERAAELADRWKLLAETDAEDLTGDLRKADDENARGMRLICFGTKPHEDNLQDARALFEAATARAPENAWYSLNLAYANEALGDSEAARAALDRVLSRKEAWASDVLTQRRLELDAAQAEDGAKSLARTFVSFLRQVTDRV